MTIVVPGYKVVVTFERRSKIPADRIVNTFHYIAPSQTIGSAEFGAHMNVLKAFYDTIGNDLSSVYANGPTDIEVAYTPLTTERPPPGQGLGPPVSIGGMGFTFPPTLNGLPAETAICVTLDGTVVTDSEGGPSGPRPAARKRNRKYIGPLAETITGVDTDTKEVRPEPTFRQRLVDAVVTHLIDGAISIGWQLMTHSPTNWTLTPPLHIWTDNAFDTQRRRGELATSKTTVVAPQRVKEAFIEAHAAAGVAIVDDPRGGLVVAR